MTSLGLIAALLIAQSGQPAPPEPGTPLPLATPELPLAGPALTLDDALGQARTRNLDLAVAREQLERSKEFHVKAWSAYLPQVTASGSYTHNDFSDIVLSPVALGASPGTPDVVITRQNQLDAQVQATQALISPQALFGIAAARANERVSAESFEAARRDILFGVARAYYFAVGAKQVRAVQARQLALARQHERDARVRLEAGTTPKITLLRAEIDRSRAEQDLKRAQSSYDASRVSLATLLDRADADFEVDVPPQRQVPEGDDQALSERALRDRPDVRAAGEAVTAAEKGRDQVVGRYFPTVSAFGRYGYSNSIDGTTWAVGVQLGWSLFDGFLRESDLRDGGSRVREAEAARAGAAARAHDEVVRARLVRDSALANSEKARESVALARENQRLVDWSYMAGAGTYLDVADASDQLLLAELALVSETLSADLASLHLERAAGAFDPP